MTAEMLAAALLTPDAPELPCSCDHLHLVEQSFVNGAITIRMDGTLMGYTAPLPFVAGEWEVTWRDHLGVYDAAFESGPVDAAARLRVEVVRVVAHA